MAKVKKKKKPVAKKVPWTLIFIGGSVCATAIGLIVLLRWWGAAGREVKAEFARIRSVGEPVTHEETERWLAELPGEPLQSQQLLSVDQTLSSALDTQVGKELPIVGSDPALPPLTGDWKRQAMAEVVLQNCQGPIDFILDLDKQHRRVRVTTNWKSREAALLDIDTNIFRRMVRVLQLRAYLQMREGRWSDAKDSIHAIIYVTNILQMSPDLNIQLSRIAFIGVLTQMMIDILPSAQFTADDLTQLETAVASLRFREGFKVALIADRAVAIEGLHNPSTWPAVQGGVIKNVKASYDSDKLFYLTCSRTLISGIDQGLPEFLKAAQANQQRFAELKQQGSRAIFQKYCTARAFPPSQALAEALASGETRAAVCRVLLRMASHRLRSGQWPESLDEVAAANEPPLPSDPLTQQPLKLARNGTVWTLYGVGTNLIDDHGVLDGQPTPDIGNVIRR